jgi:hypothetical protein
MDWCDELGSEEPDLQARREANTGPGGVKNAFERAPPACTPATASLRPGPDPPLSSLAECRLGAGRRRRKAAVVLLAEFCERV